jgi:probable rRNA maturation factor
VTRSSGAATAIEPPFRLSLQRALDGAERSLVPTRHRLRRWVRCALRGAPADITLRFVTENEARALNRDYRGKDYATNVLSFDYATDAEVPAEGGNPRVWGDLVICVAVLVREAAEQGKPVEAHFAHLVVHGMLHLQGFDHESPEQAQVMEALETDILVNLGYANPYV